MKTYRVEWTIELDAPSKVKAAEYAREIQLDRNSLATCFRVYEEDADEGAINDIGELVDTLATEGVH